MAHTSPVGLPGRGPAADWLQEENVSEANEVTTVTCRDYERVHTMHCASPHRVVTSTPSRPPFVVAGRTVNEAVRRRRAASTARAAGVAPGRHRVSPPAP